MPETQRKTLGDYVLEGGIKGRFFWSGSLRFTGVYEVKDLTSSAIQVEYIYGDRGYQTLLFEVAFFDVEVTPKEVKKAIKKEQARKQALNAGLAQKVLG